MNTTKKPTSTLSLLVLCLGAIMFGGYIFLEANTTSKLYDAIMKSDQATVVKSVEIPGASSPLIVPNWSLFTPGSLWSLVSHSQKLPAHYKAESIIETAVPHAEGASKVASEIAAPLSALVTAAKNDGVDLMLSSAYRSVDDQQALYDEFVETKGKAMADLYVAQPGTSEHHLGLAVDFADASAKCEADSNTCSLSSASAAWLAEHAYEYGFILRYPEGKKPLTGIAYEPWHYRYVGIPLAKAVYSSDLTLDEVLEQIYPAYAKE